jgi:hypothetical protein
MEHGSADSGEEGCGRYSTEQTNRPYNEGENEKGVMFILA